MPVSMMPTSTSWLPCWTRVGAGRRGVDHLHVPLQRGQRLARAGSAAATAPPTRSPAARSTAGGCAAQRARGRWRGSGRPRTSDRAARTLAAKPRAGRRHRGEADRAVRPDDVPARRAGSPALRRERRVLRVQHHVAAHGRAAPAAVAAAALDAGAAAITAGRGGDRAASLLMCPTSDWRLRRRSPVLVASHRAEHLIRWTPGGHSPASSAYTRSVDQAPLNQSASTNRASQRKPRRSSSRWTGEVALVRLRERRGGSRAGRTARRPRRASASAASPRPWYAGANVTPTSAVAGGSRARGRRSRRPAAPSARGPRAICSHSPGGRARRRPARQEPSASACA